MNYSNQVEEKRTEDVMNVANGAITAYKVTLAHARKHIHDPKLIEFLLNEIGIQERIWDRHFNKLRENSPAIRRANGRTGI